MPNNQDIQTQFSLSNELASSLFAPIFHPSVLDSVRRQCFSLLSQSQIQLGPYQFLVDQINLMIASYSPSDFPTTSYLLGHFNSTDFSSFLQLLATLIPPSVEEYQALIQRVFDQSENYRIAALLSEARLKAVTEGRNSAIEFISANSKIQLKTRPISAAEYNPLDVYNDRSKAIGPMFYIDKFDMEVGGLPPGRQVIIAAYSSHLKTTFAINMLYNNAFYLGYASSFYSLEMSAMEIYELLYILHAQHPKFAKNNVSIDRQKWRTRSLSQYELDFFTKEVIPDFRSSGGSKIYVRDLLDFDDGFSFASFKSDLMALDDLSPQGLQMFCIDYIQLAARSSGSVQSTGSLIQAVSNWVQDTKKLAQSFKRKRIVSVILSQISRDAYESAKSDKDHLYDITVASGSSDVEKSADVIASIWYGKTEREQSIALMSLLKCRQGVTFSNERVLALPSINYIGNFRQEVSVSDDFIASLISGS